MHYSIFSPLWTIYWATCPAAHAAHVPSQSVGEGTKRRTKMERLSYLATRRTAPIHPCRSGASEIQRISRTYQGAAPSLIARIAPAGLPGLNRYCYPVGLPSVDRLHDQRRQNACSQNEEHHIHGSFLSHTRPGRATAEDIPYRYFLLYAFLALASIGGKSLPAPHPLRPTLRRVAEPQPERRRAGTAQVCQSHMEMLY